VFNYGNVQLENNGPIHLTSTKDSLKFSVWLSKDGDERRAHKVSVQFTGRRTVAMKLNGSVDLRLLSGYMTNVT